MNVRPVAFNTYKDNFLDKRVSAMLLLGLVLLCFVLYTIA